MNRFMGSVGLRTYLLLTSLVSIAAILISLLVSYRKMFLTLDELIWLTLVTVGAGILSLIVHLIMTRPIERAIDMISRESQQIAQGDFRGELPLIGPVEFQAMAVHFNQMSRQLNESFQQLRSSEASRRELVANVSHDLRTPLASIQSFVEALQDDLIEDPDTYQRYLSTIRLETQRLSGLINDLFDLSRREAGAESFEPEAYHLDNLIVETLQSHLLQIEEKGIEVEGHIPEGLPPVSIMPNEIKRVVSNLLHNALRHSPDGGKIRIYAQMPKGGFVLVTVEDQGEGIAEEEQVRLFERFYRTDHSRSRASGGSGLGLAITKSIVEIHGGHVGVSSQLGKGSQFWFTVPVVQR
ncbi:sensor histidine kinase [Paenibacillus periandrae]|uniref:sensor histidine kinase n=1 Tax=Paenibacillus periandrae TaxID=1761741 RepID=UPI001F08E184|nr:HAMP domain-containing sensor histidine kinase [Paenibacillus periandrae]